jgi:hypothetical protein
VNNTPLFKDFVVFVWTLVNQIDYKWVAIREGSTYLLVATLKGYHFATLYEFSKMSFLVVFYKWTCSQLFILCFRMSCLYNVHHSKTLLDSINIDFSFWIQESFIFLSQNYALHSKLWICNQIGMSIVQVCTWGRWNDFFLLQRGGGQIHNMFKFLLAT